MGVKEEIKTAIIGGSGYTGLELIKLLYKHKFAKIKLITSNTYRDKTLREVLPYFNNLSGSSITYTEGTTGAGSNNSAYPGGSAKNVTGAVSNACIADLVFKATDEVSGNDLGLIDIVFLCLPPLKSMEFVKCHLKNFGGAIIDIGSDFRLKDSRDYKTWYGQEHAMKDILGKFVYGLPEINLEKIKNTKYIANPGCYPTSALLCLAPLADLIESGDNDIKDGTGSNAPEAIGGSLVGGGLSGGEPAGGAIIKDEDLMGIKISSIKIDSKSGVTGAGRKLKDSYLFCSMNENFYAYSPVHHRHIGEIEQELKNLSGKETRVTFTPHLLPVDRGIFTTVYCSLKLENKFYMDLHQPGCPCGCQQNAENIREIRSERIKGIISARFSRYFKNSYFVKFLGEKIPQLKDVVNTNYCQIGYALDERTDTLILFSAIDNLVKGAAGQAVQNMNIIFGFDQGEGLNG